MNPLTPLETLYDMARGEDVLHSPELAALYGRSNIDAIGRVRSSDVLLVEGGPRMLGDFFAESCLHEQFLTIAPQLAGRDGSTDRPEFVAGKTFAPEHPLWGTLLSVKRGGNHLFLRYAFSPSDARDNSKPTEISA